MIKFAAGRSGSKYVIGREGCKGLVVNNGCGALVWSQHECNDLDVKQNEMGRWLWDIGNVKNEFIRGETGWSSFEESEAMVAWLLRVVFGEHRMSVLGRAYLLEIGCNSRWWARCRDVCNKHDLKDLVNMIFVGHVSVHRLDRLGINVKEKSRRRLVDQKLCMLVV